MQSPPAPNDIVLPDGSLFGEGVKTRLQEYLLTERNRIRRAADVLPSL